MNNNNKQQQQQQQQYSLQSIIELQNVIAFSNNHNLNSLSRKELQRFCKEFNIPANIKSIDMIDKLNDILLYENNNNNNMNNNNHVSSSPSCHRRNNNNDNNSNSRTSSSSSISSDEEFDHSNNSLVVDHNNNNNNNNSNNHSNHHKRIPSIGIDVFNKYVPQNVKNYVEEKVGNEHNVEEIMDRMNAYEKEIGFTRDIKRDDSEPLHYPKLAPAEYHVQDVDDIAHKLYTMGQKTASSLYRGEIPRMSGLPSMCVELQQAVAPCKITKPTPERKKFSPDVKPTSFSFACGGWLQFYMYGVAKCLKDHDLHVGCKFAGSSAGALASMGLVLPNADFDKCVTYCKAKAVPEARKSMWGPFRLAEYIGECLDQAAQLEDYHLIEKDTLHISITKLSTFKNKRVNKFKSALELKQCLLASAAAFPFAPPQKISGKWYIDGGLSDFQPIFNERTVTVSPWYFTDADIKPSRYIPAGWAILPPGSPDTIDWQYDLGYCDTLSWMKEQGFVEVTKFCTNPQDIFTCIKRPNRNQHKYDVSQRNKSFERFFGYAAIPIPGCEKFLDILTLFIVNVLWRQIAFASIYSELWIRFFILLLYASVKEIWNTIEHMKILLVGLMLGITYMIPHYFYNGYHLILMFSTMMFVEKCIYGIHMKSTWLYIGKIIQSLFSISLFLRLFVGSRIELNKHQKLFRQCLSYRIFVHLI